MLASVATSRCYVTLFSFDNVGTFVVVVVAISLVIIHGFEQFKRRKRLEYIIKYRIMANSNGLG